MEDDNLTKGSEGKTSSDKTKLLLVIFLVISLVALGGTLFYAFTVSKASSQHKTISNVYLPMEQSLREVEVSVWGVSTSMMEYLRHPSPRALQEYKDQLADIQKFMGTYKQLAHTKEQKQAVVKFEKQWSGVVALGNKLLSNRDKLQQLQKSSWDTVHAADDILDFKIQAALLADTSDAIQKEKSIREVEVSLWEANNAMNYYLFSHGDFAEKEFNKQLIQVNEFWTQYKSLPLSESEKQQAKLFEAAWKRAVGQMQLAVKLSKEIKEDRGQFIKLINQADDTIDFDIQAGLVEKIEELKR